MKILIMSITFTDHNESHDDDNNDEDYNGDNDIDENDRMILTMTNNDRVMTSPPTLRYS